MLKLLIVSFAILAGCSKGPSEGAPTWPPPAEVAEALPAQATESAASPAAVTPAEAASPATAAALWRVEAL